jgi:hypothetical protein
MTIDSSCIVAAISGGKPDIAAMKLSLGIFMNNSG